MARIVEFRKTEFASDVLPNVCRRVWGVTPESGEYANAVQTGAYSGVGAGPSFRREYVRVSDDFRLTLDYFERCGPQLRGPARRPWCQRRLTNPPVALTQALCMACASSRR